MNSDDGGDVVGPLTESSPDGDAFLPDWGEILTQP